MRIGIAAGLLLAAVMTVYLATRPAGEAFQSTAPVPFVVVTHPPGCTLTLDDQPVGTSSTEGRITIGLDPGNPEVRWIEARKPGYQPTRWAASAYSGLPGTVLRLSREPIEVTVTSVPNEAEVWIDGEIRGLTPLTTRVVAQGDRPLKIAAKRAGYESLEREIDCPAPGEPASAEFRLTPGPPGVAIVTEPEGAEIEIDGQPMGKTPLTCSLPIDKRGSEVQVVARLDRHETVERTLTIPSQPAAPVPAFLRLERALARLVVETQPSGALVRVNGRDRGVSPITVRLSDEEAKSAIRIEGLLGGAYYGRTDAAIDDASRPKRVALPLEMCGRRVAIAVDGHVERPTAFELVRAQAKDRVHALQRGQSFVVLTGGDGQISIGPDDHPVTATTVQKIRAYDRLDAVRGGSGGSTAMALLREALRHEPDSVWLFTDERLNQAEFLAALSDAPKRATVQIVTQSPLVGEPWLRDWLAEHRGILISPDNEQTADAR